LMISLFECFLIAAAIIVFITPQLLYLGCTDLSTCWECMRSISCPSNFSLNSSIYNVTDGGTNYKFEGTFIPDLQLYAGRTYTFNVFSPNQPFWITTTLQNDTKNGFFLAHGNGVEHGQITLSLPYIPKPFSLFYVSQYDTNMSGNIQVNTFIKHPDLDTYLNLSSVILVILVVSSWIGHGETFGFLPSFGFVLSFCIIFIICFLTANIPQWTTFLISACGGLLFLVFFIKIMSTNLTKKFLKRPFQTFVGILSGILFCALVLSLTPLFGLLPTESIWIPLTCGISGLVLGIPSIIWERYISFTASLLGACILTLMIDTIWVHGVASAIVQYWYQNKISYMTANWQPYLLLGFCVSLTLFGTLMSVRYRTVVRAYMVN